MSVDRKDREASERLAQHYENVALQAVSALVSADLPQRALLLTVAEHAARALGASTSRVVRMEPDGTPRVVVRWPVETEGRADPASEATRPGAATSPGAGTPPGAATPPWTRRERRRPVGRRRSSAGGDPGGHRTAAASVRLDGLVWGAIDVEWEDGEAAAPESDERLARFADLLTLAVTSAAAGERRDESRYRDRLTGLENQRGFADGLAQEAAHAAHHGEPLGVVVFDIDHFGRVNAQHGHETGDRVLVEVARRLRTVRRSGDLLARIGGEEFAWVLPAVDDLSLVRAAERARAAVTALPFPGVGHLRLSAGVCCAADAADARHLVRRAELALFWAKTTGRDAVVQYSAELAALESGGERWERQESEKAMTAIRALAGAVDAKDPSTQRHSERVATLVSRLASASGWSSGRTAALYSAALVHDVGKIAVPERILLKPDRLDDEEYEVIKTHAARGAEMVADLLPAEQVEWIRHHHERHDGRGYPDGAVGAEISAGARLLALADAWDAMTGERVYSTPRSTDDAIAEVRRQTGRQFSPDAVDALMALHAQGVLDELAPGAVAA